MGTDNVRELIAHFINSAKLHIDPVIPGFSEQFMPANKIDDLYLQTCLRVSKQHFSSGGSISDMLS
jgi:O-acetylhomoserine (thiol)-lyase